MKARRSTYVGALVLGAWCVFATPGSSNQQYSHDVVAEVWGRIHEYTGAYIVVSGKRYEYGSNVIIDTASLKPDPRGNTRVQLDVHGKAVIIFFYGIDMPDVFKRYRRW